MKWNNGLENKRFEKRWEILREKYKEAGMPEKMIQKIYEHDKAAFRKERIFHIHNQYIPDCEFGDGGGTHDGSSPLLKRYFDALSTSDSYFKDKTYGWIEELDNRKLYDYLRALNEERLDLLTKYVFEEKTQEEIAKELGISRSSVADRISRLKNNLKKIK